MSNQDIFEPRTGVTGVTPVMYVMQLIKVCVLLLVPTQTILVCDLDMCPVVFSQNYTTTSGIHKRV